MSWWTEVLLTATTLDNDGPEDGPEHYPAIDYINEWLRHNGWWDMFQILPPSKTQHYPNACFAGHFKNLDHDGFLECVGRAPWEWAEQVQVFLRQEDDEGFQAHRITPITN